MGPKLDPYLPGDLRSIGREKPEILGAFRRLSVGDIARGGDPVKHMKAINQKAARIEAYVAHEAAKAKSEEMDVVGLRTPTFAHPPLSPERAPNRRPSGARTTSPAGAEGMATGTS